ncbi:MAG: ribosome maturation factor RimP [Alphaproteobacteria bacterium]
MSLISETQETGRIVAIIEPSATAMGLQLVRIMLADGPNAVLQIMVDRIDGSELTVDHCAELSRTVSALLDVADPISQTYSLEVSSPGLDRPLTRPQDFERFAGYVAKIEMRHPRPDGRRRFRGRLLGLSGDDVRLALDNDTVDLPFDGIGRAKLLLTDERLAAAGETKQRTH